MVVGYDERVLKGPTPSGPHMRILSDIYNVPLLQIHGLLTEPRSKPVVLLPSASSNLVAHVQTGHPTHGRRCGVRIVRHLKKQVIVVWFPRRKWAAFARVYMLEKRCLRERVNAQEHHPRQQSDALSCSHSRARTTFFNSQAGHAETALPISIASHSGVVMLQA